MSNIFDVEESGNKKTAKVIEPGTHDAVLVGIVQLGVQERAPYKGEEQKPAQAMRLIFEIPELSDSDGPAVIGMRIKNVSLNERSTFFKIFKSMGILKEPTNAEMSKAFGSKESTKKLLGIGVSLTVKEFVKSDDSKGSYVESAARLDPRLPQPEAATEPFLFTFKDPDLEVFKTNITSYGRKEIMSALNVKELPKAFHEYYIAEQDARQEKKSDEVI